MATISLCMIVKNEEKLLESALSTIYKVADEIIITDTGSTDRTVEIAKKFTDKIYHFKWIDDLSAARNFGMQFATKDYILKWDADWFLRSHCLDRFLKIKDELNADLIDLTWNLDFNKKNQPIRSQHYHFLFRNHTYKWIMPEHERLQPIISLSHQSKQSYPEIEVDHFKDMTKKSRYNQTRFLLEKIFKNDQNDLLSVIYYAQGWLFDKQYSEALKFFEKALILYNKNPVYDLSHIVEKTIQCCINLRDLNKANKIINHYEPVLKQNLRFKLIKADFYLMMDYKKAQDQYEDYLNYEIPEDLKLLDYSDERYVIHPNIILGKLYFKQKEYSKAKEHFKIAFHKTLVEKTKNQSRILYFSTKTLSIFEKYMPKNKH
jgi:glycosyltransferase involved in cell wall biosynthesis